ncbi:sulfotransferase [Rubritalea sp.]|uniref:sulfotransferase n=1 Tax=Rubritalea sp. TaxID=2109375 RepID=UPI003EF7DEF1
MFEEAKKQYADYLTFYHECRIPKHPFFDLVKNQNLSRLLIVSSPSRMGNHLLMSMLDGHPELPVVPGEDGFHMFSFTRCNYDIKHYVESLRSADAVENMMEVASNGAGSKWRRMKELADSGCEGTVGYSGIGDAKVSSVVDFEGRVVDVDFESYYQNLSENLEQIIKAKTYNEVFCIYLRALMKLVPQQNQSKYDGYMVHGAMRTQLLWICQTMPNAKILTSLRPFDSYAISQIKSKHGDVDITKEMVQVAWEHWYHKVIDMLYLRLHYPEQVALVSFNDLIEDRESVQRSLCGFLGIEQAESMNEATIMGLGVKGNSWRSRSSSKEGEFYRSVELLDHRMIPESYSAIWELVKVATL